MSWRRTRTLPYYFRLKSFADMILAVDGNVKKRPCIQDLLTIKGSLQALPSPPGRLIRWELAEEGSALASTKCPV